MQEGGEDAQTGLGVLWPRPHHSEALSFPQSGSWEDM